MPKRTHTCGELRVQHVGQAVILEGWVARRRDHGGVIFVDLRDRYGLTQIVFRPESGPGVHSLAETLRSEYVVRVNGAVGPRPDGAVNPKLPTGEIEVTVTALELLNTSEVLPFEVEEFGSEVNETARLKYRYIDLRRPRMQRNIITRHRMWKEIRDCYDEQGFLEIETPFLGKSTPEGARDYLVPSRIERGRFYALPQSPQLFKQILMVSGFDKYFQVVRCFRDEDTRANRQPEFTQLDVEISFASEEDVLASTEGLMQRLFKTILGRDLALPLPRMTYDDAVSKYGTDAPDLRFGMTLVNVSDLAAEAEFRVFRSVLDTGGKVVGLCAKGAATLSRKDIDELTAYLAQFGAKGLAWFKVEESAFNSPIAKFFPPALQAKIRERMGAAPGDILLFVADEPGIVDQSMKELRLRLGRRLNLINPDEFNLSWIVDFPLFGWNKEENRLDAVHHPFTAPKPEDEALLDSDPLKCKARAYDLVLNGTEIGGGSIRIHRVALQEKIFKLLSISAEDAERRFGFFLRALSFGAPPHGGIALGLERTLMIFLGEESLREVIAFPKTQKAQDLLTEAPAPVDAKQLRELGIRIVEEE